MAITELATMPALAPLFAASLLPRWGHQPARIPHDAVRVRGVQQSLARLADYDRVCGFAVRDQVPPTWLHVLAFPLQVHLLASKESTLRLAGVVHVSNRMRLHRAALASEPLEITMATTNLRPHRRGALLDVVGEIEVDGELVWDGVSTYLAPGVKVDSVDSTDLEPTAAEQPASRAPLAASFTEAPPVARWRLRSDLGRQYRRVSGDPNPIHTHALAARAFGFARPIIHGMWSHARLMAMLEPKLPAAYQAEVDFTKPILLPAEVGAWWHQDAGSFTGAVTTLDGHKPYLLARVTA